MFKKRFVQLQWQQFRRESDIIKTSPFHKPMKQVSILCFFFCISINHTAGDLCAYNFSISDIPNSFLGETLNLLLGSIVNEITNCAPVSYSGTNIKIWLHTRNNPSNAVELFDTDTSTLKGRITILLIHAFLCNPKNDLIPELKDAYLKRYDSNILMVDWSFYSLDFYANCYCNIPRIAKTVAEFLCKADSDGNINIEELHIVGHSMGAQMAGLIGQHVQEICSKMLLRISGMDPAGPLYNGKDRSKRLDASDAKDVMVCHSNQGILGYIGNCGTADFYPNYGVIQPGCSPQKSPASNLLDKIFYPVACSHLRCTSYMIESISSNNFKARGCSGCNVCKETSLIDAYGTMGEDFRVDEQNCSYYLRTNSESPFGCGEYCDSLGIYKDVYEL